MADLHILPTADRRQLVERVARQLAIYGYEPCNAVSKARAAHRRELIGMGIPAGMTKALEDRFEAAIWSEVRRLKAECPDWPMGGDAA